MSDAEKPERPVVRGLIALVTVAVAVGLILGIAVLVGGKFIGLGGGGGDGGDATAAQSESMSLPPLEKTTRAGEPEITLNTARPSGSAPPSTASSSPGDEKSKKPDKEEITLQANPLEVGNFERITLTGTFPKGEGEVLQVQRFQDKKWVDFAATAAVSGGSFSTYIQTGVAGVNTFRMILKSRDLTSNEVKVTVNL